jgi:phosphoribosyl-AMP cyclohydrolase
MEEGLNIDQELLDQIKFDDKGLVPAVAQDTRTGEVLMLAYMNKESLQQSIASGYATYWSRSRAKLWKKGETSGHTQKIDSILIDCDADSLVLLVNQNGPACHTGEPSCFYRALAQTEDDGHHGDCSCCSGCK